MSTQERDRIPITIDYDITILGLEVQEIAVVLFVCGLVIIFLNPFLGLIAFIGTWGWMYKVKKSKPAGYVQHMLYRYGPSWFKPFELPKGVYRP